MDSIEEAIREKIVSRVLPRDKYIGIRAGRGLNDACDGCGQTIHSGQVEIELGFSDGRTVRLHFGCCSIWLRERTARPSN